MSKAKSQPGVPDTPEIAESTIEDRLYTVKYTDHEESHLGIELPGICAEKCVTYECTSVCPADVWQADEGGVPTIAYENCLECGSCRFACPHGNVEWEYPETGSGVSFKYG